MQEQMRKLVEESHTKKAKKNKKKDFTENARPTTQTKKKKPAGEVKPAVTDSVSASISNVVRRMFDVWVKQHIEEGRNYGNFAFLLMLYVCRFFSQLMCHLRQV